MNETSNEDLRPHQASMIGAAVISLILWLVPIFGFILLPLQYLNTHLHEFSHALMAVGTGGQVESITVYANGSGVTPASGNLLIVASAGYLGATLIGGLMIALGKSERGAAFALRGVSILLAISMILWVRGDFVGVISGIFWTLLLFALPSLLKDRQLVFASQFLGMQQCLASVQALYVLLKLSVFTDVHSDAQNMATASGIPAMFWALLWGAIGLATLFVTFRMAWSTRTRP